MKAASHGIGFDRLDVNWEDLTPRDSLNTLNEMKIKRELGVSNDQILRELGYSEDQIQQFKADNLAAAPDVGAFQQSRNTIMQAINQVPEDEQ